MNREITLVNSLSYQTLVLIQIYKRKMRIQCFRQICPPTDRHTDIVTP